MNEDNAIAATTLKDTRSPLKKVLGWLRSHPIKLTEHNIIIGDLMNLGIWALLGAGITWLLVRKR